MAFLYSNTFHSTDIILRTSNVTKAYSETHCNEISALITVLFCAQSVN